MSTSEIKIETVATKPYDDQKLGTSGLRKKVSVFKQLFYVENLIEAYFTAFNQIYADDHPVEESTFLISGDGRYFMKDCIDTIIKVAVGNKVKKIYIAVNGICSTPAASYVITRQMCHGAIILTASHNPGGPKGDFGIKFNRRNGGPESETFTDRVYAIASKLQQFHTVHNLKVDIGKLQSMKLRVCSEIECKLIEINVINVIELYSEYMLQSVFCESLLKSFFSSGLRLTVNSLHGVMGDFVKEILINKLGMKPADAVRCNNLEDFGGLHPDPNLTYAAELMDAMKEGTHDLGAAFDGDGDRNMIIGKNGFFVNPCDSVAIIAAHYNYIPYFECIKKIGVARSMPTSGALDRVAEKMGWRLYETPTGWKFFGNLMDAGEVFICGEESFGTSSSHIREKDGMWALFAWMTIVMNRKMSVEDIVKDHWQTYGRNYYSRYDYEGCDPDSANAMMEHLETLCQLQSLHGKSFQKMSKEFTVNLMDNFKYKDPVDNILTEKQGIRILFTDLSRIIFRLSGTGSSGATIRMYVEYYEPDKEKVLDEPSVKLKPLIDVALEISQLTTFTGRTEPTVIT